MVRRRPIERESRSWPTRLRHAIEFALVAPLIALLGRMALERASAIGGWLGRAIGPRLPMTDRARVNLGRVFPDWSKARIEQTVTGMWDNLGRVLAEYAHLGKIQVYAPGGPVEVVGAEHIDRLRDDGIAGMVFSGHFGNWEIASLGPTQRGVPVVQIYRALNNPLLDRLLHDARENIAGRRYPKGSQAARAMLAVVKAGEHLAILVDQKLNTGIPVRFFGRDAMTTPVLAEFALRYDIPVVPIRVERLGGARFRLSVSPPLAIVKTGDHDADLRRVMTMVNELFERWIRERPEQWLWLHRRWPSD